MKKYSYMVKAFVIICAVFCLRQESLAVDLIHCGGEAKVPIVMYHKLSKSGELLNKWIITPEEFEQDLIFFKNNGFETVFISELIEFVNNGGILPPKPIVITFDDGDSSVYRYALPLLKKYNMKAVVSIIGEPTDRYSKESDDNEKYYPHLTWDQVKELAASGLIEIQNHSYGLHHSRGALKNEGESLDEYKERFSKDITALQDSIYNAVGVKPDAFTYPFGLKNDLTDEILRELGLSASLSCYDEINDIKHGNPECLYSLGRTLRPHGSSPDIIFKKFL